MMAFLRGVVVALALVGVIAAIYFWRSEAARAVAHSAILSAEQTDLQQQLVRQRQELEAARADVADQQRLLAAEIAHHQTTSARLLATQNELEAAMARADVLARSVEERRAELEAARAEFESRRSQAREPMPEAVRRAVVAFEECLIHDGHHGLRLIEAGGLDGRGFQAVEFVAAVDRHAPATFVFADRMGIRLDRAQGTLELIFEVGRMLLDGVASAIPEAGHRVVLHDVDGPHWERRLPTLIEVAGEYPAVLAERDVDPVVDPATLRAWLARLAEVLARGGTEVVWDVGRCADLRDARFLDISLHGYDQKGILQRSLSVRRLAVEIDSEANVARLLLEDGVLRKAGGDTTIPATGYRILLPALRASAARDLMLGMVVEVAKNDPRDPAMPRDR
jgi:multidrug efflux pump subunit AcrA (membrane-fusion protein)